jgi:hypothetical protein
MWNNVSMLQSQRALIDSIRQTGFQIMKVLNEQLYMCGDDSADGNQVNGKRKMKKVTGMVKKAVKIKI